MKGLRRSCVTRPLWSAVLTGGILLTCPAPAAAQQTPAPAPGLYRWITPPPDQQLKADTTPVPSGMGAVFVPAMSNGIDEPETLVYQGSQRVGSGLNGTRIILPPGDYVLRIGSGPLDQMMSVPVSVTAGNTTLVPVVWSGMMIEVVDRNNVPHRGSYELIQVSDRQPYTVGFGADTLLGERIRTILLAPGLYRIVRPGANYRTRTDFTTVEVPEASMVYFKLVLDPDDGRLLGGGVVPPEELGIVSEGSAWTRRITVGLGLPIASTDERRRRDQPDVDWRRHDVRHVRDLQQGQELLGHDLRDGARVRSHRSCRTRKRCPSRRRSIACGSTRSTRGSGVRSSGPTCASACSRTSSSPTCW